jgi:hypothetical protein
MTRRPLLLFPLLLAACDSAGGGSSSTDEKIECAVDGAPRLERICAVERMVGPEGLILTLRAPSGSFRRLLVTRDGRGVVAADGAEAASVAPVGEGLIEVTLGGDRYRLPATVK